MKRISPIIAMIIMAISVTPFLSVCAEDVFSYTLLSDGSYEVTSYKGYGQEQVNIPSDYLGRAVTAVGDNCFSVISGENVSYHPEIRKITVPYTINSIGDNAFTGTTWIDDPTTADENGFVIINNILVKYQGNASLLTIPEVTTINYRSFAGNEMLTGMKIPLTVTKIMDYAFADCVNLNAADLPENLSYLGSSAFRNTGFHSVTVPVGITVVASSLFYGCKNLTTVNLNGYITSIGKYAFTHCTNLKTVNFIGLGGENVMPANLYSVGYGAFFGCSSLKSMKLGANTSSIGDIAFANCNSLSTLYVPETAGQEYIGQYAVGFSMTEFGDSYIPVRNNTIVYVIGTSLGRANTPFVKYCAKSDSDGLFVPVSYVVQYKYLLGDANGNGKINAADARLILRHAADLEYVSNEYFIDANLDGKTTAADARFVLRVAAELDYITEMLETSANI